MHRRIIGSPMAHVEPSALAKMDPLVRYLVLERYALDKLGGHR